MARRPLTPRVSAAARHNIKKAQITRIRIREPRSLGRVLKPRRRVATTARRLRR